MVRLAALLLACLGLLPLAAQGDPSFRIKITMAGRSGEASYTSSLEIGYAPCAIWTGGSGGWKGSPAQFLKEAGGLAAIRPGMSLPFYAETHSGSAQGSDGSSAQVVTLGPGFARWTERDKSSESMKQSDASEQPYHHQSARFYRTASGARIADFDLGLVSAGLGGYIGCVIPSGMEIDSQQLAKFCVFDITNEELANWKQVNKSKSTSFKDGSGSVSVTAQLYAELEDPGEVDVEIAGYDEWIPEGNVEDPSRSGNTLKVIAKVHATGAPGREADRTAELSFELVDLSREPGVCSNWPTKPELDEGDLRLRQADNSELEMVTEDRKLRSKGLVKEATLVVSAFDYAAWGVLKVTAKDKKGKELKVTYHKQERSAIQLPKDEDRNRIADAWQKSKGVEGFPASWDESEVPGQSHKGDGLTLFQKYRGFMVAGPSGRKYTRLEPREKVHFIIDPHGLLDVDRWRAASGIRAYKVFESWTQDRKVDIHADYAHGGGKYASRIRRDPLVLDSAHLSDKEFNDLRKQWAVSVGRSGQWRGSPGEVEDTWIYSGRIHDNLCRIRDNMRQELRSPNDQNDPDKLLFMKQLGLPVEALLKRLDALTDGDVWALVKPVEAWLTIHEVAHTCGAMGHLGPDGHEDEDCANRVPSCPMQYLTWQEKRRLVLFGEMGGTGKFCSQAPHLCFKGLSPKG